MDHIDEHAKFKNLPYWKDLEAGMRTDLVAYLERGIVPTGGLYGLLTNDMGKFVNSDIAFKVDLVELRNWYRLIDQELPMASVGTDVRVQAYARNIRHQLESRI